MRKYLYLLQAVLNDFPAVDLCLHDVRHTDNSVDRRSDIMRHTREEIRFCNIRALYFLVSLLRFAESLLVEFLLPLFLKDKRIDILKSDYVLSVLLCPDYLHLTIMDIAVLDNAVCLAVFVPVSKILRYSFTAEREQYLLAVLIINAVFNIATHHLTERVRAAAVNIYALNCVILKLYRLCNVLGRSYQINVLEIARKTDDNV